MKKEKKKRVDKSVIHFFIGFFLHGELVLRDQLDGIEAVVLPVKTLQQKVASNGNAGEHEEQKHKAKHNPVKDRNASVHIITITITFITRSTRE